MLLKINWRNQQIKFEEATGQWIGSGFLHDISNILMYMPCHTMGWYKLIVSTVIFYTLRIYVYVYRWLDARSLYLGCYFKTPYLGAGFKSAVSRRRIQEYPISALDSRTPYLRWDFCFSDFAVVALCDFKICLL